MNTAERVVYFLDKRRGQYFCDDCIVQELRLSKPVTRMTDYLGRVANHRREVTVCSRCGEQKLSIMFPPKNPKQTAVRSKLGH
jgi:hypothetical protein